MKPIAPPQFLGPKAVNEDVVGRAELAEHFGVSVHTIDDWRRHRLAPLPRGRINHRNDWWLLSDWAVFASTRRKALEKINE